MTTTRDDPDPEVAERTLRELAAVTDAELAADIRAAALEVAELAEAWRRSPAWTGTAATDLRAYESARAAAAELDRLDAAAPLAAVVGAVSPILGLWWSESSPAARAASEAVERLRYAAMHRPGLVADARLLTHRPPPGW